MSKDTQRTDRSDAYGFFGVISAHVADPVAAFDEAAKMIADEVECSREEASAFLDSRPGRLFAEDVAIELGTREYQDAVGTIIERWQEWKMARQGRTAKGGPYLASVVMSESLAFRVSSNLAFH